MWSTTPETAFWMSRHTSMVTHWPDRAQHSLPSTQLTGARLPSRGRRISPTVYWEGARVSI